MTIYLPGIFGTSTQPVDPPIDMYGYIFGDGRIFWVTHWQGGAFHQTTWAQAGNRPVGYQLKGNPWGAEYEELSYDRHYIYRGTDTSMGGGRFYTLYDDDADYWSRWCPRFWNVGDVYERNPLVVIRRLDDCRIERQDHHRTWIKLAAYYNEFVPDGDGALAMYDVVELHWLLSPDAAEPVERYWYAADYGLIAWGSGDRRSYITRDVAPSELSELKRQVIRCEMPAKDAGHA